MQQDHEAGRRRFIINGTRIVAGTAALALPGMALARQVLDPTYTVQQIIDIITKDVPGTPFAKTVDTIKYGRADMVVHGIVTTMFPTIEVIRKAVAQKANFIIAHEPTYYNGQDNTAWVANNKIVAQKQQLLEQHGMTIWRFHDHSHSMLPDMIGYAVLQKMGWTGYYTQGDKTIDIPPITLKKLVAQLKSKLGIAHLRVIGNLQQSCKTIGLLPGSAGGQRQVSLVEEKAPDVLIVGEQIEWETTEYIRDLQALGGHTAMIVLGHAVSEEPGMEAFATWLRQKLPQMPIAHIASGDPYTWL